MSADSISFWLPEDRSLPLEVGDEVDVVCDGETVARARVTATGPERGHFEMTTIPLPKWGDG